MRALVLSRAVAELYDLAIVPDVTRPMALGFASNEILGLITHDPLSGPMIRPMTEGTAGCSAFDDARQDGVLRGICHLEGSRGGPCGLRRRTAKQPSAPPALHCGSMARRAARSQPHLPIEMHGNQATAPPFAIKQRS